MAKLTTAEIIDAIKELTVLELNDLVKACEEEFGVSAAAGVVVAAAAGDAAAAEHLQHPGKRECRKDKADAYKQRPGRPYGAAGAAN